MLGTPMHTQMSALVDFAHVEFGSARCVYTYKTLPNQNFS